ncbi:FadR/GntR family transcriptional regulator [Bordetella sp. N]|uniref:FadR/GntR family transcriptional regulator n=1 Tax=Bordetella sp. N TaxID=1746199 RepID=UPI00070BAE44|nr:FadR/GntR family transcriptional regulator [Bordetella sp. N]ALM86707.1 GntR family transcriptional regulator [Bordetella sp. N]
MSSANAPAQETRLPVLDRGQRVRLGDQLYGQIFDQIASGRLNVGDKLPSEHEICEQFGVSRPVVREALLRLRADGLVSAYQGLGTFVSHQPAPRLKTLGDVQNVGAYLRAQEVRVALEGDAARLAALRRTDEQLKKIADAAAAFAEGLANGSAAGPGRVSAEADLAFHASIAEASGNDFYLAVLETIHESIQGFMRLSLNLTRTGSRQRAERVVDEHAAILGAIREQDGERARVAMQFHLGQARHRLVDREKD